MVIVSVVGEEVVGRAEAVRARRAVGRRVENCILIGLFGLVGGFCFGRFGGCVY